MTTPHSFEPAVPVHTYQRIVDQIEQAIISGEIPVGSQLSSERDLMVQFGVSRPTVREALRILQSMGLLESRPGTRGGPVVLAPSSKTLSRSLRALVGTDALDVAALVEYRVVLEGTTSRLAAVRHNEEQLGRMQAAIEQMERDAEANADTFAAADIEFHEAIWEASGNEMLRLTGEAVSGVLRGIIQRDVENEQHDNQLKLESAAIDRRLFEAIAEREASLASQIARRAVADRFGLLIESDVDRQALAALAE
ncbi:FadR/GntR family transcriptional regulator [Leucobacter sp. USHLN153]|uniref:FadR/GntR family transcriptional regulator n=1 Tax=Leucobacter sp. USHLN153 TaxID=3081268 RepID=UPI0030168823